MIRTIGKLEYVGINGEGSIYIIISKKSQDQVEPLVTMIKKLEGEDVMVDIRKLNGG